MQDTEEGGRSCLAAAPPGEPHVATVAKRRYPMNQVGWRGGAMILAALVGVAEAGRAGDWPGWRGPTGLGYTDEKDLPLTWNGKTGQNILWKTPLRGGGP